MASLPVGSRTVVAEPSEVRMPDFEHVNLTASDGVKITGYAIRNNILSSAISGGAQPAVGGEGLRFRGNPMAGGVSDRTLLYFHANAGNMGHRLPIAYVFYQRMGCNVFLLSYRGYGKSEGEPSEKGIKLDSQAALDWLTAHPVYGKTKIILYGQSLGGAVAIDLARRNPTKIHALIAENTFLSIRKLIPSVMPIATYFTYLCHQVWDSESAMRAIPSTVPILLLSGKKDELIPREHMLALASAARESRAASAARRKDGGDGGGGAGDKKKDGEEKKVKVVKDGEEVEGVRFVEFANGTHNDTCIQEGYFDAVEEFWRSI
ncbi:hypothetical protein HK101_003369 [Irineochytrium annulatum]|nr:hypothetical protein HK101_003369 [Irineochytrium annulatum]